MPDERKYGGKREDELLERRRKGLLVNQDCVVENIGAESLEWLDFLFDSHAGLQNLLQKIYNEPDPGNKVHTVREFLKNELETIILSKVEDFIDIAFSDDNNARVALKEMFKTNSKEGVVSRTALAWMKGETEKYLDLLIETVVSMNEYKALEKDAEPEAAKIAISLIIESLPPDFVIGWDSAEVNSLRKYSNLLGKKETDNLLKALKNKYAFGSKALPEDEAAMRKQKYNLIDRIKRALPVFIISKRKK